MKKLVFVAAALAAGVWSFAALAGSGERASDHVAGASSAAQKKTSDAAMARTEKTEGKRAKAARAASKPAKAQNATLKAKAPGRKSKNIARAGVLRSGVVASKRARVAVLKSRDKPAARVKVKIDTKAAALTDLSLVPPDLVAKPSVQYASIVSRYATSYGVPVDLAHAVIKVESNYRPDARGSAGEIGLMQIKPATARMMGYTGSAKGLYNPETNIMYGMKYLGLAHKLGGGATCGTILRYNAGHAAKRMNPVSSAYCSKVKGFLAGA